MGERSWRISGRGEGVGGLEIGMKSGWRGIGREMENGDEDGDGEWRVRDGGDEEWMERGG